MIAQWNSDVSSDSTDRSFDSALVYCFSALQDLAFADRALVFVEPKENWALLFVRQGPSLCAYSTNHQEQMRRYSGTNYSMNQLELAVENSQSLEEACHKVGVNMADDGYGPAKQVNLKDAMALVWLEIPSMISNRYGRKSWEYSPGERDSIQQRLESYALELFSEHLGIRLGLQVYSNSSSVELKSADSKLTGLNELPELNPLGVSHYSRRQKQLNIAPG